MRVERSTLSQVQDRLDFHKRKQAEETAKLGTAVRAMPVVPVVGSVFCCSSQHSSVDSVVMFSFPDVESRLEAYEDEERQKKQAKKDKKKKKKKDGEGMLMQRFESVGSQRYCRV